MMPSIVFTTSQLCLSHPSIQKSIFVDLSYVFGCRWPPMVIAFEKMIHLNTSLFYWAFLDSVLCPSRANAFSIFFSPQIRDFLSPFVRAIISNHNIQFTIRHSSVFHYYNFTNVPFHLYELHSSSFPRNMANGRKGGKEVPRRSRPNRRRRHRTS